MKLLATLAALAVAAGFSVDASAQEGGKRSGKRRDALLKKFDKDGDGKLNERERAAAKEAFKARRGEKDKDGKGGKRGLRKKILKRFDRDGNGRLDETEREALRKFLESPHKRGEKRRGK